MAFDAKRRPYDVPGCMKHLNLAVQGWYIAQNGCSNSGVLFNATEHASIVAASVAGSPGVHRMHLVCEIALKPSLGALQLKLRLCCWSSAFCWFFFSTVAV